MLIKKYKQRYPTSKKKKIEYTLYVIFKNRAGVLYRDLKHEAIAECFRPDKARTASFLNVF